MKIRLGATALVAMLALTACSSATNGTGKPFDGGSTSPVTTGSTSQTGTGSSTPPPTNTDSGTGGTSLAFCTKLKQAETELSTIGTSLADPTKAKDVLSEEATIFGNLAKGAPAEIAPALNDLASVIGAAAAYLKNPGSGSPGALSGLETKLPDDIQKLTAYIAANCH
ncbi:MAG: hypothetical protein ABI429_08160 [Jatrophihabitantaceae bacterium]